jgi:hypothetical protein
MKVYYDSDTDKDLIKDYKIAEREANETSFLL